MPCLRLCYGLLARHMHGGKSKTQKLVTVRVPHTATPNYQKVDFVKVFHSRPSSIPVWGPFRLGISGCCTKVHFLLPHSLLFWNTWFPPLYDLTPCTHVFLACLVPLINSVLSSCISVQGNRLLLEPLLSRPHCLNTNITNGRLYLQRKSTMCLLPVLFLELLEFEVGFRSDKGRPRVAGLSVTSPALFCS